MALNMNTIKGDIRPVHDRVIVTDMYFGEQKTKGGLIIRDDNGSTRGIYPRWGKVHAKGPDNKDPYEIGDWILIEHGRWTRSVKMDYGEGEKELRMIDANSVLAYSNEKPDDVQIGGEYSDGEVATVDPSNFVRT